jgi:hypothetical protein
MPKAAIARIKNGKGCEHSIAPKTIGIATIAVAIRFFNRFDERWR